MEKNNKFKEGTGGPKRKIKKHTEKRYDDLRDIAERLESESPAPGDYLFDYRLESAKSDAEKLSREEFRKKYKINFHDLPLSENTIKGLTKRGFVKMTEIERCTIPHALVGRDIMGASRTGTGKTLSYLIPVIELLYREKYTDYDGLGALIICPTRELAVQVFEVLASINTYHEISMGLVIGGKKVKSEQEHIHHMNILVCTPGRLLQHMEETESFETSNLKILVIDEADLLLEMGFKETLNAILEQLPKERQTILFSATLGKQVHELGRLSLESPEYVFLHEVRQEEEEPDASKEIEEIKDENQQEEEYETPQRLSEYYMLVPLGEKLSTLFSFLRMHKGEKILVFLSTCKQVRFVYETFKRLKIGMPIMELHGRQSTEKRMAIFFTFEEKKYACLLTTNVAARGLDFPAVDWVVEADCPENVETYVHRCGRTARYKAEGKALLMLTPQESKFADKLKERKFEVHKIEQNPTKKLTITGSLQAFCTEDVALKYLAEKAFICYLKCINNMGDKEVFDVHKVAVNEFAESLGLVEMPLIKFKKAVAEPSSAETDEDLEEESVSVKKSALQKLKEKIKQKKEGGINEEVEPVANKKAESIKHLKEITRTNTDVMSTEFEKIRENEAADDEGEFLTLKRKYQEVSESLDRPSLQVSKRQLKIIKPDGHFGGKNKIFYDQNGNKLTADEIKLREEEEIRRKVEAENIDYAAEYMIRLSENAEQDEANEMARRKEKRVKRKLREKRERIPMTEFNDDEEEGVILGSNDDLE